MSLLCDAMVTTTFKTVLCRQSGKVFTLHQYAEGWPDLPSTKRTTVTSNLEAHYLLRKQSLLTGIFGLSLDDISLAIPMSAVSRLIHFAR